jgi:hypothetical protein
MRSSIGKTLAFAGAAVFTFFGLIVFFSYWDWVPRTCTLSGCPSWYSIEAIHSYTVRNWDILLADMLGFVVMLTGLRGLATTPIGSRVLPVLVGILLSVAIMFLLLYWVQNHATVTSVVTVTSTTTISPP